MKQSDQILKLIEEFGKASNQKIDYVALQKAKTAKAMALTSFMEARRIKNLYMLNDINDSDEESDLDDLDDLSDDE